MLTRHVLSPLARPPLQLGAEGRPRGASPPPRTSASAPVHVGDGAPAAPPRAPLARRHGCRAVLRSPSPPAPHPLPSSAPRRPRLADIFVSSSRVAPVDLAHFAKLGDILGPEQTARLVRLVARRALADDASPTARRHLAALADLSSAALRHRTLCRLAVLAVQPELLDLAGVQRFLESHRKVHGNGGRLRDLVGAILHFEGESAMLRDILTYRGGEIGPAAEKVYRQETIPAIDCLLSCHQALATVKRKVAPGDATHLGRILEVIAGVIEEVPENRSWLTDQLQESSKTWQAPGPGWRNPQNLLLFQAACQRFERADYHPRLELERLRAALRTGSYPSVRHETSAQMQAVYQMRPQAWFRRVWEAGEALTLAELSADIPLRMAGWQIVDTCDACDFVNSGTEVDRCCQHVQNFSGLGLALLGRLFDASRRMLAIKKEDGTIAARAMFRMMTLEDRPILLLSQVYRHMESIGDEPSRRHIVALARRRGAALGLEVVCDATAFPDQPPYQGDDITAAPTLHHDFFDECQLHLTAAAVRIRAGALAQVSAAPRPAAAEVVNIVPVGADVRLGWGA